MKVNAELMALTACHIRDGGSGWIYLAAPYTHPDYAVRCARYEAINVTFRELVAAGLRVFSPITLTHPISSPDDPSEIWWGFDDPWLRGACAIAVLTLDDWEHSKGVAHEIKIAKDMKKPLIYLGADYESGRSW